MPAGRRWIRSNSRPPISSWQAGLLDQDNKPAPGCRVETFRGRPAERLGAHGSGRAFRVRACLCGFNPTLRQWPGFRQRICLRQRGAREGGEHQTWRLQLGQTQNQGPGTSLNRLKGIITDPDGKPAAGAQVALFPTYLNGTRSVKTGTDGAYKITWPSRQQWQNGGPLLIVRDLNRNFIATAELDETTTNLNAQMKPALTLTGLIQTPDGAPLAEVKLKSR